MASRYAHAKQFKRHHRLLRSRLGRIIRDIRRKITGRPELEAVFEATMARAAQIRSQQQRQRGWKLYFFHAPEVECIIYEGCGSPGCRRAEVRSGRRRTRGSGKLPQRRDSDEGFLPCHNRLVKAAKLNKGQPNATKHLSVSRVSGYLR
jgi:hypothetical protein